MQIRELRVCSDREFEQIGELLGVLSPGCAARREVMEEILRSDDAHLFVATDTEGRIVGMATVCCYTIPTGRHATIEDVVVLPECQGQGLGRRLVQTALDCLRDTGRAYKAGLTSKPARLAANALYRSMGFRPKETNVYVMDINKD